MSLQILAAPLAALTLALAPPQAFVTLAFYYFFGKIVCHVSRVMCHVSPLLTAAETWFSLLFTVLVELVPASIRSLTLGTFLFLVNNLGGNLPLLVQPLAASLGLHTALYLAWPATTALSEQAMAVLVSLHFTVCLLQAACFSSSRGSNSGGKIILIR